MKLRNDEGESLIFTAAKQGHMKLIPILVKAGAPINESGNVDELLVCVSRGYWIFSCLCLIIVSWTLDKALI